MVNKIIEKVENLCSWLSFSLVILITVDVFLRYVFNFSSASLYELEWHFFAAIFLLGSAVTLQKDHHVRVDVFYNKLSKKKKEAILKDLGEGELLYAASWYRNYCRNETLIDLTKTPDRLKEKILEEYKNQDPWHNKGLVFPYLINKNMKQLIESVEEFV